MQTRALVVIPAVLLVASTVFAGSLEEQERWSEMRRSLDTKIARAAAACETKLAASYDTSSFDGVPLDRAPVQRYCEDGVYALEMVCRTPEGKKAVKSQVSAVRCRRGKDGTRAAIDGKDLVIAIDPAKTGIVGKKAGSYSWLSAVKEVL